MKEEVATNEVTWVNDLETELTADEALEKAPEAPTERELTAVQIVMAVPVDREREVTVAASADREREEMAASSDQKCEMTAVQIVPADQEREVTAVKIVSVAPADREREVTAEIGQVGAKRERTSAENGAQKYEHAMDGAQLMDIEAVDAVIVELELAEQVSEIEWEFEVIGVGTSEVEVEHDLRKAAADLESDVIEAADLESDVIEAANLGSEVIVAADLESEVIEAVDLESQAIVVETGRAVAKHE